MLKVCFVDIMKHVELVGADARPEITRKRGSSGAVLRYVTHIGTYTTKVNSIEEANTGQFKVKKRAMPKYGNRRFTY